MSAITVEQAAAELDDIVRRLAPGEIIVLTQDDQPVAQLTKSSLSTPVRSLGFMPGSVTFLAEDFDAPLDDFRDYAP